MTSFYIIGCIVVGTVTWGFGFWPWGVATAIALPIVGTIAAGLFPTTKLIQANIQVALEGLSYGRVKDAEEHISIALREAEEAKTLDRSELESLAFACEKVAESLMKTGQTNSAQTLKERCGKLTARIL